MTGEDGNSEVAAVNAANKESLEAAFYNLFTEEALENSYKKLNSAQRLILADKFIADRGKGYADKAAVQQKLDELVVTVAVDVVKEAANSGIWNGVKPSTFTGALGIKGVTNDNLPAVKSALQSAKKSLTDKASIELVVKSVVGS